eukprot:TRINITY_DN109574_c0_g1_i1.p1 TRINITY_DN109574_c0_g1~~TRINITY_DN109574_c0_g1_i1.p1  ORF type:complete len:899 (-),score=158.64 TRINITY_DN109574_c0_g1_i1:147-2444(-)
MLLRGNPSCVEAVSCKTPLYAGQEWQNLLEVFDSSCCTAVFEGKRYRSACAGSLLSITGAKSKSKSKKKEKSGSDAVKILSEEMKQAAVALARRACPQGTEQSLRNAVLSLAERVDQKCNDIDWGDVAWMLMEAATKAFDTTKSLPAEALDAWVDSIRHADFNIFAQECANQYQPALTMAELPVEWSERLSGKWPKDAGLVFMTQTGSFMYNLHTASSDSDFSMIYLSPVEDLASRNPPSTEFHFHVNAEFGSDKTGEIEYSGKELAAFIVELAKGNPRNIELLFTRKQCHSSSVWEELRDRRRNFLTLRCAAQYLGFISDRLHKAAPEVDEIDGDEAPRKRFSKCMYHAYHKIFELKRILSGGEPSVVLEGEERGFVMGLRLQPPQSSDEASTILEAARAQYSELGKALDTMRESSTSCLPAEVDEVALAEWLRGVRVRQAGSVKGLVQEQPPTTLHAPTLSRSISTRSAGHSDVEAITAILDEIEKTEGIRIVHAGYAPSSRTLGTMHENSDHDVHIIYTLRRSAYFGLNEPMQKFSCSYPPAGDMTQVDVSGWEVRHACRMLAQGNPSVLHVLHSPVEFRATKWTQLLRDTAAQTLDRSQLALAWWQHGRQNYREYILRKEKAVRKKYVHVMRPLLCMQWLLSRHGAKQSHQESPRIGMPPSCLLDLAQEVFHDGNLSDTEIKAVADLVAEKDKLPLSLPKDRKLDDLIQRLLQSGEQELDGCNALRKGRATHDTPLAEAHNSQWNCLCVSIIEQMSSDPAR